MIVDLPLVLATTVVGHSHSNGTAYTTWFSRALSERALDFVVVVVVVVAVFGGEMSRTGYIRSKIVAAVAVAQEIHTLSYHRDRSKQCAKWIGFLSFE